MGLGLWPLGWCEVGVGAGGWRWAGAVALSRDAHLSDDEAIAKMGHPDVGYPPAISSLRPHHEPASPYTGQSKQGIAHVALNCRSKSARQTCEKCQTKNYGIPLYWGVRANLLNAHRNGRDQD
jgi:hypothetical protein